VNPIHHGLNIAAVNKVYRMRRAMLRTAARKVSLSRDVFVPIGRYPHLNILTIFAKKPFTSTS
jgi:hypothetical protein